MMIKYSRGGEVLIKSTISRNPVLMSNQSAKAQTPGEDPRTTFTTHAATLKTLSSIASNSAKITP